MLEKEVHRFSKKDDHLKNQENSRWLVKQLSGIGQQCWLLLSAVVHFICCEASDLPDDSSKRTVHT